MRRSILFTLLAFLLALALISPAEAHATLVMSEPAAGALLQAAPQAVTLEFSEELDPSFTMVQLVNSKNQVVEPGPGTIDLGEPHVLRLMLGKLPTDSYTAIWRVRSAVDGHVTQGNVPFGIGVAANTTSLFPPPGTPDPATETPPPLDSTVRWLNLLMAVVALGGLPFGLFVWRPALQAATSDQRPAMPADLRRSSFVVRHEQGGLSDEQLVVADNTMTKVLRRLLLAGGALFLLTNLLFLVVQAADAAGVPILQAIGTPVVQLLSGRSGQLWLARFALMLVIGLVAWRLSLAGRGAAFPWWLALALGGAVVLTISLNAHGAAVEQGSAIAVVLDWLHIAATVAWLGGLVPLAIAIRAARRTPDRALPLASLIPHFSRLGMSCIVILTLTGIYSYILHIGSLDLLAATTYGRALIVKLGLFALLLLAGGLNLFIFSPRLRAAGNRLAGAFGQNVRVELIAGALLLLAVGAMTSVAPSKTAWDQHERLGLTRAATVGDVDLVLRAAPGQIGDNEFAVDVTDRRPGAQSAPTKVLLLFDMVGMDMGKLQTETRADDTQRYTARGSFVSMGGRWNVEVVLRRAGFDDVRHTFQLDIVRSAVAAS